ncbi:hypothetical protein LguiA_003047 [Lonicera macranthoides]
MEYAENAKSLPPATKDADKLVLYGLYKQATNGPVNISRPGMFSPKERAKWDAWKAVEGKSKEEAMGDNITKIYPDDVLGPSTSGPIVILKECGKSDSKSQVLEQQLDLIICVLSSFRLQVFGLLKTLTTFYLTPMVRMRPPHSALPLTGNGHRALPLSIVDHCSPLSPVDHHTSPLQTSTLPLHRLLRRRPLPVSPLPCCVSTGRTPRRAQLITHAMLLTRDGTWCDRDNLQTWERMAAIFNEEPKKESSLWKNRVVTPEELAQLWAKEECADLMYLVEEGVKFPYKMYWRFLKNIINRYFLSTM